MGHPRSLREPLPAERVDEQIDYEINADGIQRLGLTPTDETSFKNNGKVNWTWYIAATTFTVFHIAATQ